MARILSIDEGTTGVRATVVDDTARPLGGGYREFRQYFPHPGHVEHDANEIWDATVDACHDALTSTGTDAAHVSAIGITNQRETAVLWDRARGEPIHRAIVWQDRRTADVCEQLRRDGHAGAIRDLTGLLLDPYFSATKVAWLLDHVDGARERAKRGELAFGTMDSWLVWRMTAGRRHVTEPSNASRTMLYDIHELQWSDAMCELLRVPPALLAEVRDSSCTLGRTDPEAFLGIDAPITGVAGDQQAALFGQGCWEPGMSKNTYGTGSFLLLNTGTTAVSSEHGLLSSVGWRLDGRTTYILEGAIFVTGAAVQWLRDGLGVIDTAADTEALAAELPPGNEGVYLVPAFVGLGAPYWDPHARATLMGLTRGTDRRHLARAALEAMAYQSVDVARLMERDADRELSELRVDGGACDNDLLCQFQADVLGVDVIRPDIRQTTVMGAAYLAGLGAGIYESTEQIRDGWQPDARFVPSMNASTRDRLLRGWHEAVDRSRGWATIMDAHEPEDHPEDAP